MKTLLSAIVLLTLTACAQQDQAPTSKAEPVAMIAHDDCFARIQPGNPWPEGC